MSKIKYTPGPWSVHQSFPYIVVPAADIGKAIGGSINPDREADEYAKKISAQNGTDLPEFWRSRVTHEEAHANARLIAAAPDLLEAAKLHLEAERLAKCRAGYDEWQAADDKACAAIAAAVAKAEG